MMRPDPSQLRLFTLGAFLFLISFVIVTGLAQAAACGKRPEVTETLRKRHGEQPSRIALASDGRVIELWASEKGGWTLLATRPNGYACVIASGHEAWEILPLGAPA